MTDNSLREKEAKDTHFPRREQKLQLSGINFKPEICDKDQIPPS